MSIVILERNRAINEFSLVWSVIEVIFERNIYFSGESISYFPKCNTHYTNIFFLPFFVWLEGVGARIYFSFVIFFIWRKQSSKSFGEGDRRWFNYSKSLNCNIFIPLVSYYYFCIAFISINFIELDNWWEATCYVICLNCLFSQLFLHYLNLRKDNNARNCGGYTRGPSAQCSYPLPDALSTCFALGRVDRAIAQEGDARHANDQDEGSASEQRHDLVGAFPKVAKRIHSAFPRLRGDLTLSRVGAAICWRPEGANGMAA